MKNTSGIEPFDSLVLIKPIEAEMKTAGGIVIPHPDTIPKRADMASGKQNEESLQDGVLVAYGPRAWYEMRALGLPLPEIGRRVAFRRYQQVSRRGEDGGNYWLMKDEDVLAGLPELDIVRLAS
jgi:co-chaperonin GroES (HSP10)